MLELPSFISRFIPDKFAKPTKKAAAKNPVNTNSATNAKGDQLALTVKSKERNPYNGVAPSFSKVTVDKWGEGKNGSLDQILMNQGYTSREIYSKGENGKTLLDEVSRVNGLRDANLIQAGQGLVVPSKEKPEQADVSTPAPAEPTQPKPTPEPAPTKPAPVEAKDEPKVNEVKVDRYGQGPNGSMEAILRNQGFTEKEIYAQDAKGDSLLKKVARANGLEDPDKIQAGATLKVPNSQAALEQMDIPEPPPVVAKPEPKPEPAKPEPQPEPAKPEPKPEASKPEVQQPEPETTPPVQVPTPKPDAGKESEPTANMGMLIDGVKNGEFDREEFQYLNARSSRYAQMRARFSNDGYTNEELKALGKMEKRYGVEFSKLAAEDDVKLPAFPASSTDPEKAVQVAHYHESGPLYDRIKNGASSEDILDVMTDQRNRARQQELK